MEEQYRVYPGQRNWYLSRRQKSNYVRTSGFYLITTLSLSIIISILHFWKLDKKLGISINLLLLFILLFALYIMIFIILTAIMVLPNSRFAKKYAGWELTQILSSEKSNIEEIVWSPDGKFLASRQREEIVIWDVQAFTVYAIIQSYGNNLVWSPDGDLLAFNRHNKVSIWNKQTKTSIHKYITGQKLQFHGGLDELAWSPDGKWLLVFLIGSKTEAALEIYKNDLSEKLYSSGIFDCEHSTTRPLFKWSPDGTKFAFWKTRSAGQNMTITIFDIANNKMINNIVFTQKPLNFTWLSEKKLLFAVQRAMGAIDFFSFILYSENVQLDFSSFYDRKEVIFTSLFDKDFFVAGTINGTIHVWDIEIKKEICNLEGHTDFIWYLSFSQDKHFLISGATDVPSSYFSSFGRNRRRYIDKLIRAASTRFVWRVDTWEKVAQVKIFGRYPLSDHAVVFHPSEPLLATITRYSDEIFIWKLDYEILLNKPADPDSLHYTNAKVVLVGDSGVGKSGLGLVLTDQPFAATESTHGRHIWPLQSEQQIDLPQGRKASTEILLWDLAGQPTYRIVHQLHLNEVAVALVVFDGKNSTDPFAGVLYWDRALRQAQMLKGTQALPLIKFLVAARNDRGGPGVSSERICKWARDHDFYEYFITSAREGQQIAELRSAIISAIDWSRLPIVSSTRLFKEIKDFLLARKEAGLLLQTGDELYRAYQERQPFFKREDRRAEFLACIGRVEAAGLITRLSFGDLVLLQPELLDAYASALIHTVRDEPDGLGYIAEQRAREGDFTIPKGERIPSVTHERLLLIAMVEDLLKRDLALREDAYLVFPSESTRKKPGSPEIKERVVTFSFEGPVMHIYTTLAVRLANGGFFQKDELWKDAITYRARARGLCGLLLRQPDEGEGMGELTLFFDEQASEETRFYFEQYVQEHLKGRALLGSLTRRRIVTCHHCSIVVDEHILRIAKERGMLKITCPICETPIALQDREERLAAGVVDRGKTFEMDTHADQQREREVARSIIEGKRMVKDFDVFLCHNGEDKSEIKVIGRRLKDEGILPWLDEWELPPGQPWQRLLEQQIGSIKSAAVFVGRKGIGPWQQMELDAFLREFVRRGIPVIPVLLAGAPRKPELPIFLQGMTWVDFRGGEPDSWERLVWGITGKRPRV